MAAALTAPDLSCDIASSLFTWEGPWEPSPCQELQTQHKVRLQIANDRVEVCGD